MKERTFYRIAIIFLSALVILLMLFQLPALKNFMHSINYLAKTHSINEDDVEIERKWLAAPNKIPFDLDDADKTFIEQTYICFSPEIRVRKLNNGEYYTFTVKSNMSADGIIRNETEFEISVEEYNTLFAMKQGTTIKKTRYQVLHNGQLMAIDIFDAQLEGLAYLEIEFENIDDAKKFNTPDWVIKEVTDDIAYKNAQLAQHGFPDDFIA